MYLKMGSVFTVNVQFDSPHLGENMFLRMMCVFTCAQDIHDPVNRCPNHIEKDHEKNTNIMDHIVRCRRPDVMYYGAKDKVAFSERLAMVLPMGRSHIKSVSDTIGLEFMCQNSCAGGINRRATALMFILENQRQVSKQSYAFERVSQNFLTLIFLNLICLIMILLLLNEFFIYCNTLRRLIFFITIFGMIKKWFYLFSSGFTDVHT